MPIRNGEEVTIDISVRCLYNEKDKRGIMSCCLLYLLTVKSEDLRCIRHPSHRNGQELQHF